MIRTTSPRVLVLAVQLSALTTACGDSGRETTATPNTTASSSDPSDATTDTSASTAPTSSTTGTAPTSTTTTVGTTSSTTTTTTTAGVEPDLLEDDFEDDAVGGPPDAALWTMALVGSNGTITIDDTVAHSGTQSVRVHHEGFSTFMAANGIFPVPNNRFYGRAWFRLETPLPQNHVNWIEAGVAANDVDEARIGANIGQLDVNHWPGDEEQRADVPFAAQTWHCLEFNFDGELHEIHIWFDGEEVPGLTVTDWTIPEGGEGNNPNNPLIDWAPQFESVRFGWELGGGDIWFDDIALATTRVGCG